MKIMKLKGLVAICTLALSTSVFAKPEVKYEKLINNKSIETGIPNLNATYGVGFESSEDSGFTLGYFGNNQVAGFTQFTFNSNNPQSEDISRVSPIIDRVHPKTGSQHLSLVKDDLFPTGTNIGTIIIFPEAENNTNKNVFSVDVALSRQEGSDLHFQGRSRHNGETLRTWWVDIGYQGNIRVIIGDNDGDNFLDNVTTGTFWTTEEDYFNIRVETDPTDGENGSLKIYKNDALIFTTTLKDQLGGVVADHIYMFSDNWQQGGEIGDIDNVTFDSEAGGTTNPDIVEIQASHSALWYNPVEDGHGLNIYMLENNGIVAVWYIYDDAGNPLWLIGSGTHDGSKATVDVSIAEGGNFPPNFDPAAVNLASWGQFELEFYSCNQGLFKWLPESGNGFAAGELDIIRLTTTSGLTCSDAATKIIEVESESPPVQMHEGEVAIQDAHSALWYNPDESGHGINVYMLDNNNVVLLWYIFDNDGKPLWLIGSGTHDGLVASLNVSITEGGFFPPNFNTDDVNATEWGTFELSFTGCDSGVFKWEPIAENGFTAGETNLTRLTNIPGLTCQE